MKSLTFSSKKILLHELQVTSMIYCITLHSSFFILAVLSGNKPPHGLWLWWWMGPFLSYLFSALWVLPLYWLSKPLNSLWYQVIIIIMANLDGTTCLRLSHAISRVRTAHVMQKLAHNSRHSTLPIPTIVINPITFFVTYTTEL